MCFVYKMNVVVTRSPFEAARSEVDVSEAMKAEIIYNKLDYIDWKLITTENTVSSNYKLTRMAMELYTRYRFTKVILFVKLTLVILSIFISFVLHFKNCLRDFIVNVSFMYV